MIDRDRIQMDDDALRESFKNRLKKSEDKRVFVPNPDLEEETKRILEKEKNLKESETSKIRRKEVNDYLVDVDKKSLEFKTADELSLFFKGELDNLVAQREKGVYNEILEGKILLISMRYRKIIGTKPR